jgi:imidazolonepropionase-like amidohydrolase
VKIAIGSFGFGFGSFGGATQGRWLLIEAAYATGYGLSDEDALKAVTINAAEILGVDDRVGSLEPGKDADVIVLDGYPLDIKTWVDLVMIGGEVVHQRER